MIVSKPGEKSHKGQVPVQVRLRADGARDVRITGDFCEWSSAGVPMSPDGPGIWTATLRLAPGEYQYRFIVDGEWRDDPEAPRVDNGLGGTNSLLKVEGRPEGADEERRGNGKRPVRSSARK